MIKIFLVIALFFFISICSEPSLSDKIAKLDEKLSVEFLENVPKIFSFKDELCKIDVEVMSRFLTYFKIITRLDLFYETKYHLKFLNYLKKQINSPADFKLVKDFTGNPDDFPVYFPPALLSFIPVKEQIDINFSELNWLPILDENNNLIFSPEDQYFFLKHVFDVESSLDLSEEESALRRNFCSLSGFQEKMLEDYREKPDGVDKFKTILGFMKQLHAKNSNESCFSLKLSLNLKGCETEYVIKFDDFLNNNDLESEEQVNEKAKYLLVELEKDLKWTDKLQAMFSEEFKAQKTEEGKPIEHQNYSYTGGGGAGGTELGEIIVSEDDNTPSDSLENDNSSSLAENSIESISTKTTSNPPDSNISTDPINDKPTNQDDSKASTTNDPNSSKKSPEVELLTKSSIQPKDPVKTRSSVHGEIVNEKTNFIKSSAEAKDDDYMFEHILICFSVLALLFVVGVVFYNKRSKAPATDL
jgi:hypothetical protein